MMMTAIFSKHNSVPALLRALSVKCIQFTDMRLVWNGVIKRKIIIIHIHVNTFCVKDVERNMV